MLFLYNQTYYIQLSSHSLITGDDFLFMFNFHEFSQVEVFQIKNVMKKSCFDVRIQIASKYMVTYITIVFPDALFSTEKLNSQVSVYTSSQFYNYSSHVIHVTFFFGIVVVVFSKFFKNKFAETCVG